MKGRSRREGRLSLPDLLRIVDAIDRTAPLTKIRITGGEPLLHEDLPRIIAGLREALPRVELAVTTNGARLAEKARALRAAGLDRLNISLDSVETGSFRRITGTGDLDSVLRGIEAARGVGFSPIKLNAVLHRSGAARELDDMVRFAAREGVELRFIELMAIGPAAAHHAEEFFSAADALDRLRKSGGYLRELAQGSTAERHLFEREGREVVVGFITSVSQPFCSRCDRLRLDDRGRLRSCLRRDDVIDLAALLPLGVAPMTAMMREVIESKRHPGEQWPSLPMAHIGG